MKRWILTAMLIVGAACGPTTSGEDVAATQPAVTTTLPAVTTTLPVTTTTPSTVVTTTLPTVTTTIPSTVVTTLPTVTTTTLPSVPCPSWIEGPCYTRPHPQDPSAVNIYDSKGTLVGRGSP